jgi:hypothetical protein
MITGKWNYIFNFLKILAATLVVLMALMPLDRAFAKNVIVNDQFSNFPVQSILITTPNDCELYIPQEDNTGVCLQISDAINKDCGIYIPQGDHTGICLQIFGRINKDMVEYGDKFCARQDNDAEVCIKVLSPDDIEITIRKEKTK